MCGSRQGIGGSNGAISGSIMSKMAADGHLGIAPSWNDGAVARDPCVSWAFLSDGCRKRMTTEIGRRRWVTN